jgi:phosphoribosylglycinamide formyltransferase-1
LASGRGSNFDALCRAARDAGYPARIAVLLSDRAGAPALEKARFYGIESQVLSPGTARGPWSAEGIQGFLDALSAHRIDAICLAGFLRVVPHEILAAFPKRVLNIHPSLLPSFPGLHATRQAIRAGVKVSGCTVHLVDEGVDTGPIVLQAAVPVLDDDNEDSLAERILLEEHRIYPQALRLLAEDRLRVIDRTVRILPERTGAPAIPGGSE